MDDTYMAKRPLRNPKPKDSTSPQKENQEQDLPARPARHLDRTKALITEPPCDWHLFGVEISPPRDRPVRAHVSGTVERAPCPAPVDLPVLGLPNASGRPRRWV